MSVQTELARIKNAKATIKATIEGKGVTVPDGTLLDGMAALIESIEAGGGDYGPFSKIIAGTYTPVEDMNAFKLPGVSYIDNGYVLAIAYDSGSGTITSGHFRIGMDILVTRVSRYYSSTINGYSPRITTDDTVRIDAAFLQAGITYRYIYASV